MVCGEVWHTLSLSCSLSFLFFFFFFFSCSFSYSCSCSCFFSFSSFFFLPFYSLFSSLPFTPTNTVQSTDQQTRRPTSRHLNVIWRRASAQQSVLSLLLSPPSSLLPLSSSKKEETFYYRNISGEGTILHYSFILIQKNRRRVKLQSLQFYINSKTIGL